MNTEEQARERLTQQRQHRDHSEETMKERAEAELTQASEDDLDADARQILTQQRQHQEHLEDTMAERTEQELQ